MSSLNIDFQAIGQRLKAYRIAAALSAEDVAKHLHISRAAVYRLEKGEIVKIETLERLAMLLKTSSASLLGVDVEYYASGIGLFERMRQLEDVSSHIYSHFSPFSFLLTSTDYLKHLSVMLNEIDGDKTHTPEYKKSINTMLAILKERKNGAYQQQASIYNLIGIQHIEHFLHLGVIGTLNLAPSKKMERVLAARREVQYLIDHFENGHDKLQISVVDGVVTSTTFQLFYQQGTPLALANSPFRLGELPNVTIGIASITSSNEAINYYQHLFDQLWHDGQKGYQAIDLIKKIMARY